MSVRSITALAVERDRADPGTTAKGGQRGEMAGIPGDPVPQTYMDTLTSSIPTEPLAAYTALVGIYAATLGTSGTYLPLRWWAYAGFLGITAASVWTGYYQKSRRKLDKGNTNASGGRERRVPVLELLAAIGAAAAWGLAMPDSPLDAAIGEPLRALAKATITIGGGAVVALLATPLAKATNKPKPARENQQK